MPRPRRSRLPVLLVGLALGFAPLLPEIGHSLAHRHAASHAAPTIIGAADHANVVWADSHPAEAHSHFDQRLTPPVKVSLGLTPAARTTVEHWFDVAQRVPPILPGHDQVASAGRYHGPPPPSRSPPRS